MKRKIKIFCGNVRNGVEGSYRGKKYSLIILFEELML